MTKKEYLKELKKKLQFKMNQEEVAGILRDYDEFFEIGLEKEKSEQVISTELGNPKGVANRLIEEMGNKNDFFHVWIRKSMIRNGMLLLFSFVCCMVFIRMSKWGYIRLQTIAIGYPIISLFLLVVLYKVMFRQSIPLEEIVMKQKEKKECLFVHGIFIFISMVLMIGFFVISDVSTFKYLIATMEWNKRVLIGPMLTSLLYVLAGVTAGFIIFTGFRLKEKGTPIYYSLIFHGMGIIILIFEYESILQTLTTLELFRELVLKANIVYIETFVICICLLLMYRRRIKNGRTA